MKKAVTLGRVEQELISRLNRVLKSRLIDKYLVKAINTHILPVAAYIMNVCPVSAAELKELDMIVKRGKSMHGCQGSDERLYLPRDRGGRGLKSREDVNIETKICIACYLWLHMGKKFTSIHRTVEEAFAEIGIKVEFAKQEITMEGKKIEGDWKKVKGCLRG